MILFALTSLNYSHQNHTKYISCLSDHHYQKNHTKDIEHRDDPTWSRYIDLVYGVNTSSYHYPSLQKRTNNFEFFYLNSNIKILSLTPLQSSNVVGLPSSFFIHNTIHDIKILQSYQWVEVMRYKVKSISKDFTNEGLFAPNWTHVTSKGQHYKNPTKVPYGCWFYTAPGSGIYVNVG